jgi:hypothetical protein
MRMAQEAKINAVQIDIESLRRALFPEPTEFIGSGNFSGDETKPVAIAHDLGVTPRHVDITPNANPDGYLGEFWYTADESKVYIYNNGKATVRFTFVAFR